MKIQISFEFRKKKIISILNENIDQFEFRKKKSNLYLIENTDQF